MMNDDPGQNSTQSEASQAAAGQGIPSEHAAALRTLAHDLSNALEIIVQSSYLLGTANLAEPASDWHRLLEQGVQKALNQNQSLRNYIKSNSVA